MLVISDVKTISFTSLSPFVKLTVMEVACGEYGDNVPKLVVAVRGDKCRQFQHFTRKKVTNCEKVANTNDMDVNSLDGIEIKETAILDDNLSDAEDTLSTNGFLPSKAAAANTNANATQNGACNTSLLKSDLSKTEVSKRVTKEEKKVSLI